ncbi:Bug family tripartite tricarboxylate transporter substrate binding protein [Ramlibacter rhizophilus]|uniref:Tripartite tricarboxylate transporter substrate binding protein n=1 Tax=Ramlibacter rhizophilus TaxID=1781167 RepID=A0A4Z0C0M5_9BURK|nr:tripartite tricarboxylate transporter substrate binding protein [Ramlibacter rhizophilus]TFZ04354.1 tripartite tricarboxylate transporter substrate binding protein [Ramlibacter rhizophilus]
MTPRFHPLRRSLVAAGLALAALPFAHAQGQYPERPIKLLVGYSAGGGVDAIARMLSSRLPELLGQQVVVENKAGAAGVIAADTVAKAPADGYTLLLGESGLLINKHLNPKMPFDPLTGFTPVAGVFQSPLMIVANNDLPVSNPKELVARAKANPGRLSYATSGVGTVHHLGMETFKGRTGTHIVHIPYRGASQIVPDVISGQVPLGVVSATAGLSQAKAGKLRAVAMMSDDKLPGAENVPALSQAVPGLSVAPRLFVLAPAGTPQPVIQRLNDAIRKVITSPETAEAAAKQGAIPAYLPPAELTKEMKQESQQWAEVIKQQKVTLE